MTARGMSGLHHQQVEVNFGRAHVLDCTWQEPKAHQAMTASQPPGLHSLLRACAGCEFAAAYSSG